MVLVPHCSTAATQLSRLGLIIAAYSSLWTQNAAASDLKGLPGCLGASLDCSVGIDGLLFMSTNVFKISHFSQTASYLFIYTAYFHRMLSDCSMITSNVEAAFYCTELCIEAHSIIALTVSHSV